MEVFVYLTNTEYFRLFFSLISSRYQCHVYECLTKEKVTKIETSKLVSNCGLVNTSILSLTNLTYITFGSYKTLLPPRSSTNAVKM